MVKFCGLTEDVRIGADIIGLDQLVEFCATEDEAIEAFKRGSDAPALES